MESLPSHRCTIADYLDDRQRHGHALGTRRGPAGGNAGRAEPRRFPRPVRAEINWGDGTPLDDDAVIVGRNGFFRVLAGHTYEDFGTFGVTLGLWQVWH